MSKVPMIVTWMGVPISEMPREELERLFVEAQAEIAHLRKDLRDRSIAHVWDLAAMAKQRLRDRHPFAEAVIGRR